MSNDEKQIKDLSKTMEGVLKDKVGKQLSWGYFILTLLITISIC